MERTFQCVSIPAYKAKHVKILVHRGVIAEICDHGHNEVFFSCFSRIRRPLLIELFIWWVRSCWTVTLRNPLPGSSLAGACTVSWSGHRWFLIDLLGFSTVQYKFHRRILREIPKPQIGIDQFRNGLARYSYSVFRISASCKGN